MNTIEVIKVLSYIGIGLIIGRLTMAAQVGLMKTVSQVPENTTPNPGVVRLKDFKKN